MGDQINTTIACIVIYKCDEVVDITSYSHIYWAHILEYTSYKENDAFVAFPKGFLIDFIVKQCSKGRVGFIELT